jgi:hypothetical protein
VANTVFCNECGIYLLPEKELGTGPLDAAQLQWLGEKWRARSTTQDSPRNPPARVNLRIGCGGQARELQVTLKRPVRIGRNDPVEAIFPEVDLTLDRAWELGVSREHMCIFQNGSAVKVEDLGSINGTLLNGRRLDPYLPEILQDGDQLQAGRLLIEVKFELMDF